MARENQSAPAQAAAHSCPVHGARRNAHHSAHHPAHRPLVAPSQPLLGDGSLSDMLTRLTPRFEHTPYAHQQANPQARRYHNPTAPQYVHSHGSRQGTAAAPASSRPDPRRYLRSAPPEEMEPNPPIRYADTNRTKGHGEREYEEYHVVYEMPEVENDVANSGLKKFHAPVGTTEAALETEDTIASAAPRPAGNHRFISNNPPSRLPNSASPNRYRRSHNAIQQVGFTQVNSAQPNSAQPNSTQPNSAQPVMSAGQSAVRSSVQPIVQTSQTHQPVRSTAPAETPMGPELTAPWGSEEFDTDGARIISRPQIPQSARSQQNQPYQQQYQQQYQQNQPYQQSAQRGAAQRSPAYQQQHAQQYPQQYASAPYSDGQAVPQAASNEQASAGFSLRNLFPSFRSASASQSSDNSGGYAPPRSRDPSMPTTAPLSQSSLAETATGRRTTSSGAVGTPNVGIGRSFTHEFRASNDRIWSANHAENAIAEFDGDKVTVRNIRYSVYRTAQDYTARYYDATFDLNDIRTIDLIEAPFTGTPSLAHVEMSFGFVDGRQLAVSIEARYEQGESYDPLGAVTNQFELIYVVADERDLIRLYTQVNKNDVYLYRLRLTQEEVRTVFIEVLNRTNALVAKPEFYHAVTNNCATNLITHVNTARPNAIPKDYRSRFPGFLDHLLFDRRLIDTAETDFKKAREAARINWLAEKYGDLEYFSAGIRQQLY